MKLTTPNLEQHEAVPQPPPAPNLALSTQLLLPSQQLLECPPSLHVLCRRIFQLRLPCFVVHHPCQQLCPFCSASVPSVADSHVPGRPPRFPRPLPSPTRGLVQLLGRAPPASRKRGETAVSATCTGLFVGIPSRTAMSSTSREDSVLRTKHAEPSTRGRRGVTAPLAVSRIHESAAYAWDSIVSNRCVVGG